MYFIGDFKVFFKDNFNYIWLSLYFRIYLPFASQSIRWDFSLYSSQTRDSLWLELAHTHLVSSSPVPICSSIWIDFKFLRTGSYLSYSQGLRALAQYIFVKLILITAIIFLLHIITHLILISTSWVVIITIFHPFWGWNPYLSSISF